MAESITDVQCVKSPVMCCGALQSLRTLPQAVGPLPLLCLLSWYICLFFAPRFQHLDQLQHSVSDLSPWPALRRLLLLDPVLRNVVAQDLRFVQGELALFLFVPHCPRTSETVTGEWADLCFPDAFVKF